MQKILVHSYLNIFYFNFFPTGSVRSERWSRILSWTRTIQVEKESRKERTTLVKNIFLGIERLILCWNKIYLKFSRKLFMTLNAVSTDDLFFQDDSYRCVLFIVKLTRLLYSFIFNQSYFEFKSIASETSQDYWKQYILLLSRFCTIRLWIYIKTLSLKVVFVFYIIMLWCFEF